MALRVAYNFQADFSHVNLKKTENKMNTSLERLSTGLRINSAKDDAAGLYIADQLGLVSKALEQGSRNSNDGISAAQIAESTLSQIYDKLTSMYTKASQAATDTNDLNARTAIQRDIEAITDAIDRMAKASEFNGQKLLTGDFKNKKIQYGPRADQSLDISVGSATAKDLGAYVVRGQGSQKALASSSYAGLVTGNFSFVAASGDNLFIAGIGVTQASGAVDAASIANSINNNADLQKLGISATAKNSSVAATQYQAITATSTTTIKFYAGSSTSTPVVTITLATGESLTLDALVKKINEASGNQIITAKADNEKLVLETQNGETIGVEITNNTSSAIDLGMFLEGVGGTSVAGGSTGAAIDVGTLDILGVENYSITYNGISAANEGFNFDVATNSNAGLKNLTSLDVTNYDNAELAMKIIDVAIKRVDKERSKLGSIQQNLQAIIDNNDFAATQTREAESRIRNVDFAKEMAEFTRQQTLYQSGIAMMAQANQLPQQVLQLLR